MSGHKRATVSISQEEYDRLRDAEGKLRTLPEPAPDTYREIEGQSLDMLRSNLDEMEKRQELYLDLISNLNGAIYEVENSTNQRLAEYQEQTMTQVQGYVGCLWNYHDQILANQANQFEELVYTLHERQQIGLGNLSEGLEQLFNGQQTRQAAANTWLYSFDQILSFIREQYAYEFFLPGKLLRYEMQYKQIQDNYAQGLFDAVVAGAQNAYLDLSEMRLELEKKQTEWQLLYQTAWEAVNQELARIDRSDFVPALDLDGNVLTYMVDVNYWTQGHLDNLYQEVSHLGQLLLDESALPDAGVLLDWLNNKLPAIHQQLENTILDARIKTINSQLRINVADLVVQALQQQGFTLDASAYQENDLRAGYGAQLRNIEGNEVIVQVSPNGNALGENELHIQSMDSEVKTEHELKRRWLEISRSLSGYGVEVGKVEQLAQPVRSSRPGIAYPNHRKAARLPMKTG